MKQSPPSISLSLLRNTILIIVINGIALYAYHKVNPTKEIERFYKDQEETHKYYLLKFAYSILFISFIFNARFLAITCFKIGSAKIMSSLRRRLL